jgi:hypothetical protein
MTENSKVSSKEYEDLADRIDDNADLILQNQRILKKLQQYNRWKQFFRILNIIIIAALAFGAFKFLWPYIEKASTAIDTIQEQIQTIGTSSSAAKENVNDALNKLGL